MIVLPLLSTGSNCCTRKYGARTLTANSLSKSSSVVSSMLAALEMPALATRMSRRSPTMARTCLARACGPSACAGRTDLFGLAAGLADHGNDGVRLLLAAAVMHQHPGAGCDERQRARAADAARGAGDQGRFSGKTGHGHGPQALVPPSTVRLAPVM